MPELTSTHKDLYPSRTGGDLRFLERRDPVLHGAGDGRHGPLEAHQLAEFERNGFLVLPGLLDEGEVERLREASDRLRTDPDLRGLDETIIEPKSDEVRSVFACHRFSERLLDLARDERLLGIAQQILDDEVYLHQTRINYKPGFQGEPFQWHSDFETWHTEDGMPRMRAVSCAVSLTENTPHNGPLLLIPGSHKTYVSCPGTTPERNYEKSLKYQSVGSPPPEALQRLTDEADGVIEAAIGPPGTVVFFDSNMMHGSNSNITPVPRSNVFMVYNADSNRLVAPFGGQPPRPEHIGHREHADVLTPKRS